MQDALERADEALAEFGIDEGRLQEVIEASRNEVIGELADVDGVLASLSEGIVLPAVAPSPSLPSDIGGDEDEFEMLADDEVFEVLDDGETEIFDLDADVVEYKNSRPPGPPTLPPTENSILKKLFRSKPPKKKN